MVELKSQRLKRWMFKRAYHFNLLSIMLICFFIIAGMAHGLKIFNLIGASFTFWDDMIDGH
jgi:hypothetical protein